MRLSFISDCLRCWLSLLTAIFFFIILPGDALAATPVRSMADVRFGDYQFDLADLTDPADVVVGQNDLIYVTDTGRHRIQIFDAAGERVGTMGRRGQGPGEFFTPRGIAVATGQGVFITDTGNHRIQMLSTEGKFKQQWGGFGAGPGQFRFPQGLAADRDRVYVADTGNDRVQVFDHQGRHLLTIGRFGSGPGEFKRPVDIVPDARGNIYVVDADNHRIQKFDRAGRFVKSWGQWGTFAGLLADPSGIHHHDDMIYVSDSHNHRVQVFDLDGNVIYQWGIHAFRPREGAGRLHYPSAVALAPSGQFAVICEGFENRGQVFKPMPPGQEPPPNPFQGMDMTGSSHYGPWGDVSGRLMALTEMETDKVSIFDLTHATPITITVVGAHGDRPGQFIRPRGVSVDARNKRLFVADSGNRRLQIFQLDYDPSAKIKFVPGMARFAKLLDFKTLRERHPKLRNLPIVEPSAVRCDSKGRVWVLDQRQGLVLVFSMKFELLHVWGRGTDGSPDSLRRPTDLAFSRSGETVFIVDADQHSVLAYTMDGGFLFKWGGPGRGDGQFTEPFGVASGKDGFVYVTDAAMHRVQKFDEKGRFIAAWGEQGIDAGRMYKPRAIMQDDKLRLVVVDYGNHRGHVFSPEGRFSNVFGSRFFTSPVRRGQRVPQDEE